MKKRNIFYICLCILVVIGLIWAFIAGQKITKNFKKDILSNALQKQKITIHGLIVTETKNNEKYWEIYAEEGHYDNTDKVVLLNNVFGNFYKDGEVVISFKSDRGTLTETTKKIVLYQNSLIVYKNGEYLYSDKVTWQVKEEEIKANGNVVLEQLNKVRIHADTATLSADWKNLKVKGNVKTELFSNKGIKL